MMMCSGDRSHVQFSRKVFCIVETQISSNRVENLADILGYDNAYAVSSYGISGGLGLFCNNEVQVEILGYLQYHIHAKV